MAKNDKELVINRVFDAPRELVWKAWTDPEEMKQWSAPRGFTIPINEGELKPGGVWRSQMRKEDGTELNLGGVYHEIVEPERLVFTHAWMDESGKPGPETVVTVILTERGNKTEMTFRQTGFASVESRDGHEGGWNECFDKLAELEELLAKR
ncbi:MAG TPA: SRPBCC domain-containing protein [Gemmatimonadaceae bacterium]|nr:SRPBCC domain-containing protein [Gemmatimonadaceae bacterium]